MCDKVAGKARALPMSGRAAASSRSRWAAQFPEAEVEAVDISEEALALAREDAARLDLQGRVCFAQGDLLTGVEGSFDLIVANLPYEMIKALQAADLQERLQESSITA